jgi:hypothetical protein
MQYCAVSSEYAENVVYPPKNPVMTNNFHRACIETESKKEAANPIANDPAQLTNRIPPVVINRVDQYRNKAPMPPPIIINT